MPYTPVSGRKKKDGYVPVAAKKATPAYNPDRLGLVPLSQRKKAVVPTREQIASRKETIQSAPKSLTSLLPRVLREGLFGTGQTEKIDGTTGFDTGLVGFIRPGGLGKGRDQKIIERAQALESVGTKTNDAFAKAVQDVGEPRPSLSQIAKRPLQTPKELPPLPKLALSKEEKGAIRGIKIEEALDAILGPLDFIPGVASVRKVGTKVVKEALTAEKKVVEAFAKSADQTKVGNFELGTFGRNSLAKKVTQIDRFPAKELEETQKYITQAYKASDNPSSYRANNIAWVADMPSGEKRVIYTRQNAKGAEEILNAHVISNPKFLDTLKTFGIPDQTRTGILSLERSGSIPLTYRDKSNLPLSEEVSIPQITPPVDNQAAKATSQTSPEIPPTVPTTLQKTLVQTPEGQSQRVLLDTSRGQPTQLGRSESLGDTLPQKSKVVEDSVGTTVAPETYAANRTTTRGRLSQIKESFKSTFKSAAKGADILLGTISTRLKNIDPSLKTAIRKYEYNLGQAMQKNRREVEPFLKKLKQSRMTVGDYADLDLALKNGDVAKTQELLTKYGLTEDFKQVQKTLESLYERAKAVGYDIGYRKNYFPRTVKDSEGLLEHLQQGDDWSLIDQAIKQKETEIGRYLNVDEKANLVNSLVRGYGGKIQLSETGAMKARQIDIVDADLNKFYDDSMGSLMRYMDNTNDAIEARKFFGKSGKGEEFGNIEDSIGKYILDLLVAGKIKPSQEKELTKILRARFNEVGTSGFTQVYKNLAYIDTMGSPISAITQIGDLAVALYKGGPINTVKALSRALVGKSKITRADIGIDKIAQEFSDRSTTAKAVDLVFKATGLNKLDTLGKETLINASMSKLKSRANRPNAEFYKKLEGVFGDDPEAVARVVEDLKVGRVTEDTKLLAFNELLDVQPVALSEMPEQYLKGGNGRIFYMLKTYTVKLYDLYRNEVLANLGKGNRVKAIRNLVALTASLVAANATADEIKDFILGRETKMSDRVVDNLLKLAGFSKYTIYKAREEGIGTAIAKTILPPFKFIDSLFKDISRGNTGDQLETIESIPIGGKLYYWWFGKGAEKSQKKREAASGGSSTGLDTPPGLPSLPKLGGLPTPPGLPKLPK